MEEKTRRVCFFSSPLFFPSIDFFKGGEFKRLGSRRWDNCRIYDICIFTASFVRAIFRILSFFDREFLQFFPSLSMLSKKEESNETVHLYNVPRAFNRASWSKLGYGVQFSPASRSSIRYFNELFKNKASLIIHYSLNRNDPRLYKPTSDQLQWYTGINTTQAFLNKVIARFFN